MGTGQTVLNMRERNGTEEDGYEERKQNRRKGIRGTGTKQRKLVMREGKGTKEAGYEEHERRRIS